LPKTIHAQQRPFTGNRKAFEQTFLVPCQIPSIWMSRRHPRMDRSWVGNTSCRVHVLKFRPQTPDVHVPEGAYQASTVAHSDPVKQKARTGHIVGAPRGSGSVIPAPSPRTGVPCRAGKPRGTIKLNTNTAKHMHIPHMKLRSAHGSCTCGASDERVSAESSLITRLVRMLISMQEKRRPKTHPQDATTLP
jgi:hypothetical protein